MREKLPSEVKLNEGKYCKILFGGPPRIVK